MDGLSVASIATEAWARRRRRVRQLAGRHSFAGELLRLYEALLDVQEPAFLRARDDQPEPVRLAAYVADRVVGEIGEATMTAGPPRWRRPSATACATAREPSSSPGGSWASHRTRSANIWREPPARPCSKPWGPRPAARARAGRLTVAVRGAAACRSSRT